PVLPPGGRLRLPLGVWASDGALVAHLDLGNRETTAGATGANLIVHFAGSDPEKSVPVLREALATRGHQDRMALTVAVVAPGKLEQKLAAPDPKDAKRGVHIAWAEDFEAEWAKVFGIQELPATFLVNAEGKMAWKHIGQANADVYRQAFDEHLVASGPPHFRRLGLKVRTGEPVPDFLFEYLEGRQVALRTLRGQPVILTFWTSWSEPSLAELRQLQKVHDQFANQGLVILAINDGENPKHARAAFEKMDLPFAFVPDPDRRISGLFGVNCWPTTVAIAEDGLVQRVQFGVSGSVPDLGQKGVAGDGESTDPLMPANVAGE
ncbi:MAG: redoxin domain-containing protein, partial [Anaerolineae bacterium]|nr:redoxin domain-containing protein [Anaerolineae bacterium]